MKFKVFFKMFLISIILTGLFACNGKIKNNVQNAEEPKSIGVYNYDNKQELKEFNQLNLDDTHPNLLNPQVSKSDYNTVVKSWTELHQKIGTYLSENKFNWEIEDSTISIVQKIYFEPNGQIKNYFFNVLNENVTQEKKAQFAELISEFAKQNKIDFEQNINFAQCGKTTYFTE